MSTAPLVAKLSCLSCQHVLKPKATMCLVHLKVAMNRQSWQSFVDLAAGAAATLSHYLCHTCDLFVNIHATRFVLQAQEDLWGFCSRCASSITLCHHKKHHKTSHSVSLLYPHKPSNKTLLVSSAPRHLQWESWSIPRAGVLK